MSQARTAADLRVPPMRTVRMLRGLNIIFHIFIVFGVVSLLYTVYFRIKDGKSITKETSPLFTQELDKALKASPETQNALFGAKKELTVLRGIYTQEPSRKVIDDNNKIQIGIWTVVGALAIVFIVGLLVLVVAIGGVTRPVVMELIGENLVLVVLVTLIEIGFYELCKARYKPITRSRGANTQLDALQACKPV